jgi:hypothetical protein
VFSYDENLVNWPIDFIRTDLMDTIEPAQFSDEHLDALVGSYGYTGALERLLTQRILRITQQPLASDFVSAVKRRKQGDREIEFFDPIAQLNAILDRIRNGTFMEPPIPDAPMQRHASAVMTKPDISTLVTD